MLPTFFNRMSQAAMRPKYFNQRGQAIMLPMYFNQRGQAVILLKYFSQRGQALMIPMYFSQRGQAVTHTTHLILFKQSIARNAHAYRIKNIAFVWLYEVFLSSMVVSCKGFTAVSMCQTPVNTTKSCRFQHLSCTRKMQPMVVFILSSCQSCN